MLTSTALVMLMMPGLALFYGGMARRKNVLGTMMHTMVALGLVGVQWVVIGYALAFGDSAMSMTISTDEKGEAVKGSLIGFSPELMGLGVEAAASDKFKTFPATDCPLYLHAMFQGMFAIITIALVSGAFAERVKFGAYCLFALLWTTLVYDPLAHWVWSLAWPGTDKPGGWLGGMGALDFAGGTVVHIAAGISGLAAVLLLRKRTGYGKQTFHPNSVVLTLLGAGLLWFGWFGFNGGSAVASNALAVSALTVTQIAAATASLTWMIVEWLHRGKPTALGFASGLVAGLVAITPAAGFVDPFGALAIGGLSGVVCYWAVVAKGKIGYDDSLDAFGIHGVGGILGAVLTGVFCSVALWRLGTGSAADAFPGAMKDGMMAQVKVQLIATVAAAIYAFVVTAILVLIIDKTIGFTVKEKDEAIGLDLSQHGEVGVDVGPDVDGHIATKEPKSAANPPANGGGKKFAISVSGATETQLIDAWSKLCQSGDTAPSKEFTAVYPYVTTVSGNTFRFRGGDPVAIKSALQKLFADKLGGSVTATVV
ncbi:MAG: ammonium transporter [Planctomycetia bacterium]|nr:ammonium transporter [Planctomycetia bacterium]